MAYQKDLLFNYIKFNILEFPSQEILKNLHFKKDRKLKGIDVAKYILSKTPCTQLKLQKLVYLCFADYLCDTGKELFTDKIYAFKYGPVVDLTHKDNAPWSKSFKGLGKLYSAMKLDTIKEYHQYEEL